MQMNHKRSVLLVFFVAALVFAPVALAQHGPTGQHGGGAQHAGAQQGGGQAHGGGMMAGPPPPESIEVPAKGTSLPLQEFGGRAVVEVKINGKGPYRFILSSTAMMTVIDAALSKELNLPVADGVQHAPSAGDAPAIVTIDELRLGDSTVRGFIGAAMSLSGLYAGEGAPRGIVGASLFQGYLVTYDYPKKRVSIEKGRIESADAQSSFEYSETRPMVPIKVAGTPARVLLDTGNGAGLTLPLRFAQQLQLAAPPKEAGMTRTSAGEFPVSKAAVNGAIELGKFKLGLPEVSFSDARAGVAVATGAIGYEVLRNFMVTLDTWNRRVRLTQ